MTGGQKKVRGYYEMFGETVWKHEAEGERGGWEEVCLNGQMSWTCEEVAEDEEDYTGIAYVRLGTQLFIRHVALLIYNKVIHF